METYLNFQKRTQPRKLTCSKVSFFYFFWATLVFGGVIEILAVSYPSTCHFRQYFSRHVISGSTTSLKLTNQTTCKLKANDNPITYISINQAQKASKRCFHAKPVLNSMMESSSYSIKQFEKNVFHQNPGLYLASILSSLI